MKSEMGDFGWNNVAILFHQGGPVMYILLALSVLATTIVLLKSFQFLRCGLHRTGFVEEVMKMVQAGELRQGLAVLERKRNPVAKVMASALRCGADPSMMPRDMEAEVSRVGSGQIRHLESWLRGLSAIAHLSPLLGLLGTVTGMIAAFIQLQEAGSRVDPAMLSGGIWEALLTTAFGLAVAIPAMAAFYYLEGEVDRIRGAMKDATVRVLVHFRKGPANLEDRDEPVLEESSHGI